jgi:hypothetical protein
LAWGGRRGAGRRAASEELMSDLVSDAYYEWTFFAYSGDSYGGFMYDDAGSYAAGELLYNSFGYYRIGGEYAYGFDLGPSHGIAENTVYTNFYYDGEQGYLSTSNYNYYGAPSSLSGLGTEYDYAWNGAYWDDFGYGGYFQAGYFG